MRRRLLVLLGLLIVRILIGLTSPPAPLLDKERGIEGARYLRERLVAVGQRLLPEPEAGLVLGVVLGYKASLASYFYKQLINSGTIHIVVASGYNVMVVGSFALALFLLLFKRWLATVFSILFMILYAVLAGGEPPVIRAAIMGSVGLTGLVLGRQSRVIWTLFLTLFVMLVYDPILIESISFQLSAAAAFGIFWLKPRMERAIMDRHVGIPLRDDEREDVEMASVSLLKGGDHISCWGGGDVGSFDYTFEKKNWMEDVACRKLEVADFNLFND